MSENRYMHYNCECCDAEVVRKTDKDVEGWICITNGSRSFEGSTPLVIAYMKKDYQYENKNKISYDIHFCCKECLVKWIYSRLGVKESEVKKAIKAAKPEEPKAVVEEKPAGRFYDLELVNNADDE